jgi:branched-chain amino acid transport system permease protein
VSSGDSFAIMKKRDSVKTVLWVVLPAISVSIAVCFLPEFWLKLLIYAGIAAIGAIGLNLLTGNTGQASLGQPFFMGIGAYTAAFVGQDLAVYFPFWLIVATMLAAFVGALVGLLALRLRGHFLIIVTFALVFIGQHIFRNWNSVTHGTSGRSVDVGNGLLGENVFHVKVLSRDATYFILIWAFVTGLAWLTNNLLRGRIGRALMSIRDQELTAEISGIDVARYKIVAFVISSGTAGLAGALFAAYMQYTNPSEWGLLLAIQYLAMIVVGGMGSVAGSIIGAVAITLLPHCIELVSVHIPFIAQNPNDSGFMTVFALNQIIFGAMIIVFIIFAPRGLAGALERVARAAKKIIMKASPRESASSGNPAIGFK